MTMPTTEGTRHAGPAAVRDRLVDVLRRDLVGAQPEEVLSVAPPKGRIRPREGWSGPARSQCIAAA
jgi:hypothetical protein